MSAGEVAYFSGRRWSSRVGPSSGRSTIPSSVAWSSGSPDSKGVALPGGNFGVKPWIATIMTQGPGVRTSRSGERWVGCMCHHRPVTHKSDDAAGVGNLSEEGLLVRRRRRKA